MNRKFLDPKTVLLSAVADWLLAQARTAGGAVALDHLLVVVPTRQAGRRLRLALAERTGGCIPPQIRLPNHLIVSAHEPKFPVATPTESLGILANLLTRLDLAMFPCLFPEEGRPADQTFTWALNVSRQFHDLWRVLQENALVMGDVSARAEHLLRGDNLDTEIRRWQDLAQVEARFFVALARLERTPIALDRQQAAHNPAVPEGVERIVLPALADAQPALYTALEKLSSAIPITVLIHADPSHDSRFDVWGRPEPTRWAVELPLQDSQITLARNSLEQAQRAAEYYDSRMTLGSPGTASPRPALGMADDALFNELQSAFLSRGVALHNPAASPVAASSLGRLILLVQQLSSGQSFTALSAFLREADVQRWAGTLLNDFPYAKALEELDALQNKHLPQTLADARRYSNSKDYPNATRILGKLDALLVPSVTTGQTGMSVLPSTYGERLLAILTALFSARTIHTEIPGDRELAEAASKVRELLDELESGVLCAALSNDQIAQVFASAITSATYQLEHDIPNTVSTEGWLELQWNPAPEIIVTGFNEGSVPDAIVGHAFLPDSLRQRLGLTSNTQRLARDTYLLQALLLSRAPGAVQIFLERVSAENNVRKPSRLLFLCDDATLVARAKRLFAETENASAGHPRTLPPAWRLNLPFASDFRAEAQRSQGVQKTGSAPLRFSAFPARDSGIGFPPPAPPVVRVTDFKSYLSCPFTYYLRNVLGMEAKDDRMRELDALAFGSLCHKALDAFAKSDVNDSADATVIEAFLKNSVWQHLHRLFGSNLTAVLHLQGMAACERLSFAAQEQARLAAEGWRICGTELSATLDGLGAIVKGRIDRIDRNAKTGACRILDYKTWANLGGDGLDRFSSANRAKAEAATANGLSPFTLADNSRARVWTDLQLPLYLLMAQAGGLVQEGAATECGYFVLGDTAADTQVKTWDFSSLRASAEDTARLVIRRIQAGIFWPPQDIAKEFLPLFLDPHSPESSLSPDWLADQRLRMDSF